MLSLRFSLVHGRFLIVLHIFRTTHGMWEMITTFNVTSICPKGSYRFLLGPSWAPQMPRSWALEVILKNYDKGIRNGVKEWRENSTRCPNEQITHLGIWGSFPLWTLGDHRRHVSKLSSCGLESWILTHTPFHQSALRWFSSLFH